MNKQLTKTELLLIRACKSNAGLGRVSSVYRKQYGVCHNDRGDKKALVSILASLVDKHCPVSTYDLVDKANPNNVMWWDQKEETS